MSRTFNVEVRRCEDASVLVGTSKDIHGLVVEAETIGGVLDAIEECAPSLIETNMGVSPADYEIRVQLVPEISPAPRRPMMHVEIPLAA